MLVATVPLAGDGQPHTTATRRSSSYQAFVRNCMELCPRQALHARTLGFVHPETGEEMFFSAPLPPDMTALIDKWRTYTKGSMK